MLDEGLEVKTTNYWTQYKRLTKDLLYFERTHRWKNGTALIDVFSSVWSVGIMDNGEGLLGIQRHGQKLTRKGVWAIFFPPYSIINWSIRPCELNWKAYWSDSSLPQDLPKHPIAFPWTPIEMPQNLKEVFKVVRDSRMSAIPIGAEEKVSTLAYKTKINIDKTFATDKKLKDLASEAGTSLTFMGRAFKQCFGLSPLVYRNKLRVMESLRLILLGDENVTEASFDVGFKSIGRFNINFRKNISAVPSQFVSKNRKNRGKFEREK